MAIKDIKKAAIESYKNNENNERNENNEIVASANFQPDKTFVETKKTYIKLNKNNEIVASANFQPDKTFVETNKKVIQYNGKLYFEDSIPDEIKNIIYPTEEEKIIRIKQEKIELLKSNCSNYIYSKYPIYKQLNVANGIATEEEIAEMTSFIQKARLICNDREEIINKAESVEEVNNINIEFTDIKNEVEEVKELKDVEEVKEENREENQQDKEINKTAEETTEQITEQITEEQELNKIEEKNREE